MFLRHNLVRVWAIITPAAFCDSAGGPKSPAFRFWKLLYPHEEDYSLTPFSTASTPAGINTLAFLLRALLILPCLTDLCYPLEISADREQSVRKKLTTLRIRTKLILGYFGFGLGFFFKRHCDLYWATSFLRVSWLISTVAFWVVGYYSTETQNSRKSLPKGSGYLLVNQQSCAEPPWWSPCPRRTSVFNSPLNITSHLSGNKQLFTKKPFQPHHSTTLFTLCFA